MKEYDKMQYIYIFICLNNYKKMKITLANVLQVNCIILFIAI